MNPFKLSLICFVLILSAIEQSVHLQQIAPLQQTQANLSQSNHSAQQHIFQCPTKVGYYASTESNPHKFWLCVNQVAYEFSCPPGTHFNVHENQCTEWIEESTSEDSLTLDHEQSINQTEQTDHEAKHRHNHHHKNKKHHIRHMHKLKNHRKIGHTLERLHRRIDELDSRLDKLYEYVDARFMESNKKDLPHNKLN